MAHYIVVEREHGIPLLVGPYPGPKSATVAMDSLLIDGFAEEDALDIYTVSERPAFPVEEVIIDMTNPHHTDLA